MRNKIVAHDDQMFPANSSAIVLDKDGTAIEAVCLGMNFNISDLPAFRDLCSLARIALQWIFEAFEDAARTVVETVNMRPLDERLGVQVGPQLTITIRDKITE